MDEIIARLDRIETLLSQGSLAEYTDNSGAAAFLGLQPATLEIWRTRREGPPFIKVGKVVRYSMADLRQWMQERRQKPLA